MTAQTQDDQLGTKNEALLREIREDYSRFKEYWKSAHDQRAKIMRYLDGNPWSDEDRLAREGAGRPCISHDELNQYIFQAMNPARQNKRGIKIEPKGSGADDKSAELRQDIARTIEYDCQAPSAYIAAFQDELEGSYGFCRVSRRYVSDETDDQEIVISHIPNPNTVLYDPNCKKPDWSDAKKVFVLDPIPAKQFKADYPDATVTSFSSDDARVAPEWLQSSGDDWMVLTAEYWRVEFSVGRSKTGRKVQKKQIVQYITNGLEILERNPQPGEEIPIVPFVGLQRYLEVGDGNTAMKRKLYGLVSFALDAQMSLAYLVSQMMEEAGLSPKTPVVGAVGQFETDRIAWTNLTKQPVGFIQYDIITDPTTGALLPRPEWKQFVPNFPAFESAIELTRRAIQAGTGTSPLPTAAQRQNQKSGIALQTINEQQSIGSFHFIDGYDRGIARIGRIVDSWIPVTYDSEDREMWLQMANDTRKPVRLNTKEPYQSKDGETEHHTLEAGQKHGVTVSSGPSDMSQRDSVEKFVDSLISEMNNLPVPPPVRAKILAIAIQMKQLGPMGDEIASIISPEDQNGLPPQAQALVAQFQQQMQSLNAYAQSLEEENGKLKFEKQAKVVDNQFEAQREKFRAEVDLAKAEITTKAQSADERFSLMQDLMQKILDHLHERGMQAADHAQANQQQQADQLHQQTMPAVTAAAQPEPEEPGE